MRVKAKTAFVTRMDGEAVSIARNTETDLPEGLAQRLADADPPIVEILDAAEPEKSEPKKDEDEADQEKTAPEQAAAPKKRTPASKRLPGAPENK